MKKDFLIIAGFLIAACTPENHHTTKEIVQDFSNMSSDSLTAKYGKPTGSKWQVNGITISKLKFEDMDNTSFENISLNAPNLAAETGFNGTPESGAPNIYAIKLGGKSEVVYNTNKKGLRVSLQK